MKHLDKHGILCDNQHGFRNKRSCESQLLSTVQEIASGKQVDIIQDKIPHTRFFLHLLYYGMWNQTKKWIESFLCHRSQQMVLDGVKSDTAEVMSGVPQGTVLGPLLFLCFINELPESFPTKLFADDSRLYKVIESDSDRTLLQRDLSALEQWEQSWQLSSNPTIYVVMRISTKKNKKVLHTQYQQYQLHGHTLDVVDISKYQGRPVMGCTCTEHSCQS